AELWEDEQFAGDHVDYVRVAAFKSELLRAAWDSFNAGQAQHLKHDFERYCAEEASWLNGYAVFTAIRLSLGGTSFVDWPEGLRRRDPGALAAKQKSLADDVEMHKFGQFLFERQWR